MRPERLVALRTAAERLGCTVKTLTNRRASGSLPFRVFKVLGRLFVDEDELAAYVRRQRHTGTGRRL